MTQKLGSIFSLSLSLSLISSFSISFKETVVPEETAVDWSKKRHHDVIDHTLSHKKRPLIGRGQRRMTSSTSLGGRSLVGFAVFFCTSPTLSQKKQPLIGRKKTHHDVIDVSCWPFIGWFRCFFSALPNVPKETRSSQARRTKRKKERKKEREGKPSKPKIKKEQLAVHRSTTAR